MNHSADEQWPAEWMELTMTKQNMKRRVRGNKLNSLCFSTKQRSAKWMTKRAWDVFQAKNKHENEWKLTWKGKVDIEIKYDVIKNILENKANKLWLTNKYRNLMLKVE